MPSDALRAFDSDTLIVLAVLYLVCSCIGSPSMQASSVAGLVTVAAAARHPAAWRTVFLATRRTWAWVLAVIVIGVVASVDASRSAKGAYDLLRAVLLFFSVVCLLPANDRDALLPVATGFLSALAIAAIAFSVYALAINEGTTLLEDPTIERYFNESHLFANSIAVLMMGLVAIRIVYRGQAPVVAISLVPLLFATLLVLEARGALVAAAMGVLWPLTRGAHAMRRIWWLLAGMVLLGLLFLLLCPSGPGIGSLELPASLLERRRLYAEALAHIQLSPLFGFGLNTYKDEVFMFGTAPYYTMPHNLYLELLFSVGIVGALFTYFAGDALYRSLQSLDPRSARDRCDFWSVYAQQLLVFLAFRALLDLRLGFGSWAAIALAAGVEFARSRNIAHTQCI